MASAFNDNINRKGQFVSSNIIFILIALCIAVWIVKNEPIKEWMVNPFETQLNADHSIMRIPSWHESVKSDNNDDGMNGDALTSKRMERNHSQRYKRYQFETDNDESAEQKYIMQSGDYDEQNEGKVAAKMDREKIVIDRDKDEGFNEKDIDLEIEEKSVNSNEFAKELDSAIDNVLEIAKIEREKTLTNAAKEATDDIIADAFKVFSIDKEVETETEKQYMSRDATKALRRKNKEKQSVTMSVTEEEDLYNSMKKDILSLEEIKDAIYAPSAYDVEKDAIYAANAYNDENKKISTKNKKKDPIYALNAYKDEKKMRENKKILKKNEKKYNQREDKDRDKDNTVVNIDIESDTDPKIQQENHETIKIDEDDDIIPERIRILFDEFDNAQTPENKQPIDDIHECIADTIDTNDERAICILHNPLYIGLISVFIATILLIVDYGSHDRKQIELTTNLQYNVITNIFKHCNIILWTNEAQNGYNDQILSFSFNHDPLHIHVRNYHDPLYITRPNNHQCKEVNKMYVARCNESHVIGNNSCDEYSYHNCFDLNIMTINISLIFGINDTLLAAHHLMYFGGKQSKLKVEIHKYIKMNEAEEIITLFLKKVKVTEALQSLQCLWYQLHGVDTYLALKQYDSYKNMLFFSILCENNELCAEIIQSLFHLIEFGAFIDGIILISLDSIHNTLYKTLCCIFHLFCILIGDAPCNESSLRNEETTPKQPMQKVNIEIQAKTSKIDHERDINVLKQIEGDNLEIVLLAHLNIETELIIDDKSLKGDTRFQAKVTRLNDDKTKNECKENNERDYMCSLILNGNNECQCVDNEVITNQFERCLALNHCNYYFNILSIYNLAENEGCRECILVLNILKMLFNNCLIDMDAAAQCIDISKYLRSILLADCGGIQYPLYVLSALNEWGDSVRNIRFNNYLNDKEQEINDEMQKELQQHRLQCNEIDIAVFYGLNGVEVTLDELTAVSIRIKGGLTEEILDSGDNEYNYSIEREPSDIVATSFCILYQELTHREKSSLIIYKWRKPTNNELVDSVARLVRKLAEDAIDNHYFLLEYPSYPYLMKMRVSDGSNINRNDCFQSVFVNIMDNQLNVILIEIVAALSGSSLSRETHVGLSYILKLLSISFQVREELNLNNGIVLMGKMISGLEHKDTNIHTINALAKMQEVVAVISVMEDQTRDILPYNLQRIQSSLSKASLNAGYLIVMDSFILFSNVYDAEGSTEMECSIILNSYSECIGVKINENDWYFQRNTECMQQNIDTEHASLTPYYNALYLGWRLNKMAHELVKRAQSQDTDNELLISGTSENKVLALLSKKAVNKGNNSVIGILIYNIIYDQTIKNQFIDDLNDECDTITKLYGNGDITMRMMGESALIKVMNTESRKDVEEKDTLTIPIILCVLAFIIGSWRLVLIPLLTFGASICASFSVMRPFAKHISEVNPFCPSMMMSVTIAMCIDYSLFLLTQHKEEVERNGKGLHQNKQRTIEISCEAVRQITRWSGKVIVLSGCILSLTYFALRFYSMEVLQSVGLGIEDYNKSCFGVADHSEEETIVKSDEYDEDIPLRIIPLLWKFIICAIMVIYILRYELSDDEYDYSVEREPSSLLDPYYEDCIKSLWIKREQRKRKERE